MNLQKDENIGGELRISDLIRILIFNRVKIYIFCGIVTIVSTFIAFFIIDPVFFSSCTVKMSTKGGGLSGLLGSSLPDLGDFGDLAGGAGSGAKEMALFENILMSRRCLDETIIKFKLNDEWEYKYFQDAVKKFREDIIDIKKDKTAGTMEVGVFDENPARAKEIVDFLIFQLNKINTELNVLNAKNNREFIEERYNTVKSQLAQSEDSLKNFQDKFGVAPDLVVRAATQSQLQLEGDIKSEEVKLEILRKILSPDQSEVKMQEEKISALKQQLSLIQNSTDETSNLRLKGAPKVVLDYIRLQRDVEIQNKILTYIIPLFEQAKVEEKKLTPSVLVLDPPNIPERKSKPKRLVLIGIALFLGFLFSFSFFVIKNKWNSFKLQKQV